jgi:hypothetical protein
VREISQLWDDSLSTWDQFVKYHGVVARALLKYHKHWNTADESERDGAIFCAEKALMHAVTCDNPRKFSNFEAFAAMDISGDLWTYWNEKVARDRRNTVQFFESQSIPKEFRTLSAEGLAAGITGTSSPADTDHADLLIDMCPTLTPLERELLRLHCLQDFKYPEIAETLGLNRSRQWMGVAIKEARRKMAAYLTSTEANH